MASQTSRMMLRTSYDSGGVTTFVSTTFNEINPSITAEDFVAAGNALGSCCRYDLETIRRIDLIDYDPDEFEE